MNDANRFITLLQVIILMLCLAAAAIAAPGDADPTFNGYLARLGGADAGRFAIQPDGKIVVTGNFTMVNGLPRRGIVRFNPDGTLDPTFNSPSVNVPNAIGIQSTGKIIIGYSFGLRRLNTDGSLDTDFNSLPSVSTLGYIYDLTITADDKIVLSGVRSSSGNVISRLNSDGSLDAETTFSDFVVTLAVAPDGKIVFVNGALSPVRRLNQDLTPDSTFTPVNINNQAYKLIVQPDGKTLIQGLITQVNGTSAPPLVRVNIDGTVDVPFVSNVAAGGGYNIYALDLLPNGKILSGLTLRNSDGTVDTSFSAPTTFQPYAVKVQMDGKVVAVGSSTDRQSAVVRFNSDGSTDTSFQAAVGVFVYGNRVLVQPDNKILVSGDNLGANFNYSGGLLRRRPVRLNADGTGDATFSAANDYELWEILPNGKILAARLGTLYMLNSDGSVHIVVPGAGSNLLDIQALPDGRFLVAKINDVYRYNADGTLDSSFNVHAEGNIYTIALLADGKIVVGGTFPVIQGVERSKIARLNADGSLDTTFNSPPGGINGGVLNIENSPGGKFVISGSFTGISFNTRLGLARLNTDGTLDTGFVPPSSTGLNDVKVQPDGKVLLGGSIVRCRRLNADGTIDTNFVCTPTTSNSDTPTVRDIDLQSGKIIVVGDFDRINGVSAPGIARLKNTSAALFDYDGDGRSDISVFRPSDNTWYVMRSSDSGFTQQIFAISDDVPTPADFDGDGTTDFAIFRPSNGDWWYLSSVNGAQINVHWGQAGDIPRPSDFDGDGKADYVVYRPSNSYWYRYGSTGEISQLAFGIAEDIPLIGDFDGDGKSDVAIFRPSVGDWWYGASAAGGEFRTVHWGATGDVPAPADYDGDGKTDFAVYRPSEGVWYISNSGNGSFLGMNFGLAGDKPVPADYDGDGKADIAVFRPSTGIWYLLQSTSGFAASHWGFSTDVPTPHAFIP